MRFSVGPIIVGGGSIVVDADACCAPQIDANDDEQCGLDANMELLVLGNGDRRACCNCDFDDKRTLFLCMFEMKNRQREKEKKYVKFN